jgi:hypothetical protein
MVCLWLPSTLPLRISQIEAANLGWGLQTAYYKDKIERLLLTMAYEYRKTRQENLLCTLDYLIHPSVQAVKHIIRAANTVKTSDPDLVRWMASWDASEEKRLRGCLEVLKYEIDAVESIRLACGPGRIEKVCHKAKPRNDK